MTAPSGFQVDPDQIRAHAGTVGDIAGQLSSVAGRAQGGLAGNALGTFVQFLAAGLQDAMAKTTEAITHASSAIDTVSSALTHAADSYQRTDENHAARLRLADDR